MTTSLPPRTSADPALLAPGSVHGPEALTQAARAAWEVSGKTQQQAADQLGVSRVTFAHAIGEPSRSLDALRRRIIEAFGGVRVVGPLYRLEAPEGA